MVRFPWNGGRHPCLDVLVTTVSVLLGIESKRYEPFRAKAVTTLSDAYWRPVWGDRPTAVAKGGMRHGRVLSRSKPSTPSVMNRSCQRYTAVLLVPVQRMISAVPQPSAVSSTMCARHTCF
jgi:hypothetical protein